jgi:DegV family protein with EDD domain
MKPSFIISTDSCVDMHKSYLAKHGIHCIIMKRVLDGKEIGELYNSDKEFDKFYERLAKGDKPTTTALNEFELQEHFEEILEKEKEGDIIHIPLSSGLSLTCENAIKAAEEVNKKIKGRTIHVIDSLIATCGMAQMVDELIEMRDSGKTTKQAIERITELRDHQQGWVIMTDLFHLKRGGRISGAKAVIGSILGVKPIVCINDKGKLAIENKARGNSGAINYILSKIKELGENARDDFKSGTIYAVRTSKSQLFDELKSAVAAKYPTMTVKEAVIGPIIGTHLGCGGAIVLFEGAKRLTVKGG